MLKPKPAAPVREIRLKLENLEERTVPSSASADLIVAGRTLVDVAGQPLSGTVALFTDPDASSAQQTFTADINWGDGQSSVGQVTTAPGGAFSVSGSHTYNKAGLYGYTVQVSDTSGDSGSGQGHVLATPSTGQILAVGESISAIAGQAFNGAVAIFTDAAATAQTTFTANINWGDGSTSAGQVTANNDGSYTVTGSHTYASKGFYSYSVAISDSDSNTGTAHGQALVSAVKGTLVASGKDITATVGQPFSGTVARFVDPAASATGSTPVTFTANINWGDGTTSAGQVTANANGSYSVTGTHTYSNSGLDTLTVQISDSDGNSDTAHGLALVTPAVPPILAIGRVIRTTANTQFSGAVAYAYDPSLGSGTMSATINWGDGQTSAATVSAGNNNTYTISGTHTYTLAGTYSYTVQISDSNNNTGTADGKALVGVSGNGLIVNGDNVRATATVAFNGNVAMFTDNSASSTQQTFTANINWGDGSTSAGTVTSNTNGTYSVSGTHTYAIAGVYDLTIQVSDSSGDTATGEGHAFVNGTQGELQAVGKAITTTAGTQYSGAVATFTDTNTQATFSVTIDWGDGSTSAGTVTSSSSGKYTVTGSHTYTNPGSYDFTVQISDSYGESDIADGRALVTPATGELIATGKSIDATTGTQFNGAVAMFTDPNATSAETFTVNINWGDGTTSTGQVSAGKNGAYTVTGSHTYSTVGVYTLSISIADSDGNTGSATGYASVSGPQGDLDAVAKTVTAQAGEQFNGPVAYFTDPDASTTQGTFTADINWGDGQTSAGQITDINGTYTVTGTHTYTQRGALKYSVLVLDSDGDSDTAQGTALVFGPGVGVFVGGSGANKTEFVVNPDGTIYWQQHGNWQQLGSFIQTATATSDGSGNPVLYAVTQGNDLYRFTASGGWQELGAYISSVTVGGSAGNPVIYAVTTAHDLFSFAGGAWNELGAYINSVTATTDVSGNPVLYAITQGQDLFRFTASQGWNLLGADIASVSATTDSSGNQVVYAVTTAQDLFRFEATSGWNKLGAGIASVTAGTDQTGAAEAYVVTTGNGTFKTSAQGLWSVLTAPEPSEALTAANADTVFSLGQDGSIYEYQASTGWLNLGTP